MKRPTRAPVQPRVPPRFLSNAQGPLTYETPPKQRPIHQQVWRFLKRMNSDFVHTTFAAVFSLFLAIIAVLLFNPFTRRLIFIWLFRDG